MVRKVRAGIRGLVLLIVVLSVLYSLIPTIATRAINQEINKIPGYQGGISGVGLQLFSGAYQINDLKIDKVEADSQLPFLSVPQIAFTIQWRALLQGSIVSEIDVYEPIVNFAKGESKAGDQFGRDVDWIERIQGFMSVSINRLNVHNGQARYIDIFATPKVDMALTVLDMEARNLRNVHDKDKLLPSSLKLSGATVGGGRLQINSWVNVLKPVPDINLDASLEGVNLPALNDFLRAYARIDAERGEFNLYAELAIKDSQLDGYVKPVIRDMQLLSFENDKDKPLRMIWEGVAGLFTEVFENQKKDQFASKVPFAGDLRNTEVGMWKTVVNILSNAFVAALKKQTDDEINLQDAG